MRNCSREIQITKIMWKGRGVVFFEISISDKNIIRDFLKIVAKAKPFNSLYFPIKVGTPLYLVNFNDDYEKIHIVDDVITLKNGDKKRLSIEEPSLVDFLDKLLEDSSVCNI